MPQPTRPNRNDAEWSREDYLASKNLRRLWDEKSPILKLSQNKIAKQWGISQPAVSNYLNGILRLNVEMILKFATSLDVEPLAIDTRLSKIMKIKKHDYSHTIVLSSTQYTPRFMCGDTLVLDMTRPPKPKDFCVAHNNKHMLLGYYINDTTLKHPTQNTLQTTPNGYLIHVISSIIPTQELAP